MAEKASKEETTSNQKFYTIGEISEMLNLKEHVIRYWEKEFEELHPKKNEVGRRVFSKDDIIVLKQIKELRKNKGFTIKGAKKELKKLVDNKEAEKINHHLKKEGIVEGELPLAFDQTLTLKDAKPKHRKLSDQRLRKNKPTEKKKNPNKAKMEIIKELTDILDMIK